MTSLLKWGKSARTTIPVMAGYLVLGAGFGILLRTRGFGLGWALAMSLFIYAGSMQYVAVDLLTGGASLLTAAVTTLLVNARHLFYGISMLERYRAAGKYAPYLIFSLTDETYSLVAAREELTGAECFRISLLDQFYWVLGTALGSLAGAYLNVNTTGIDFSLTALFLTVFTGQWLETKDHAPALIGLGVSIVCRLLFGADSLRTPFCSSRSPRSSRRSSASRRFSCSAADGKRPRSYCGSESSCRARSWRCSWCTACGIRILRAPATPCRRSSPRRSSCFCTSGGAIHF